MKFIVNAQLPKSLSDFLCGKGYDSIHTFDLPNKNKTTDTQIIGISITENRIVISKDNDFLESLLLTGQPKKLIFVKTGNIQNADLISIFDSQIVMISTLLIDNSLVEITKTEMVVHV